MSGWMNKEDIEVHIQKRFALSPRLFSKVSEMINGVFKKFLQLIM